VGKFLCRLAAPAAIRCAKEGAMRAYITGRGVLLSSTGIAGLAIALLAGPWVVGWMRHAPDDLGRTASPLAEVGFVQPHVASSHGDAAGDDLGPAISQAAALGIDAAPPALPNLAAVSAFQPLAARPAKSADGQAATEAATIDAETLSQLQSIRQRLEELGADYVIVEAVDDSGRYRFHCRMLVDDRSRFTRPFESIDADPLAAGAEVLRAVEAWRAAALSTLTSPTTRLE
jgi:hypothetical protein